MPSKILVVEDEATIRALLRRLILRMGYEVLVAEDGKQGIAVFEESPDIALVIADVVMPNLSGVEMHKQLASRLIARNVKFGFVSGYMGAEEERYITANGLRLLQKPFEIAAIQDYITALLAS
jgi:CheY-like chemotaxis protein